MCWAALCGGGCGRWTSYPHNLAKCVPVHRHYSMSKASLPPSLRLRPVSAMRAGVVRAASRLVGMVRAGVSVRDVARGVVRGVREAHVANQAFDAGRGTCRDNACDAFRHTLWNAWMSMNMGGAAAKRFADGRERDANTRAARAMDLFNNQRGREIVAGLRARGVKAISRNGLYREIIKSINDGTIVTELPGDVYE